MRNDFRCVTVRPTRTPLEVRHEAALELLGRGELDPYEALMLVCWPPKDSRLEGVPAERRYYSEELKAEIRERHAAGETLPDLARKTGLSYGTLKAFVAFAAEKRRDQRRARRLAQVQEKTGRLFA
jgi:hypothetical protein